MDRTGVLVVLDFIILAIKARNSLHTPELSELTSRLSATMQVLNVARSYFSPRDFRTATGSVYDISIDNADESNNQRHQRGRKLGPSEIDLPLNEIRRLNDMCS